ncbi:MAG: outer membrane protein assembly factor BamB family protein [Candidatus Zipacnadales bacterium]
MVAPIAEFVKRHRHEVGKHALVIGSGMLLRPYSKTPDEIIVEVALRECGRALRGRGGYEQAEEALACWAAQADHSTRCRAVAAALREARPSEGHIRLARMIKDGYFSIVFWNSPDTLIEQALEQQRLDLGRDLNLVSVGVVEPEHVRVAIEESTRITVVKTGGDLAHEFLPLTPQEARAALAPVRECIENVLRSLVVFVAYSQRDRELLALVPGDGDKLFWVNRIVPVESRDRYDELRMEAPAAARFHSYEPEVTALLARRGSSRNLICREAGSFDDFLGRLHHRLHRTRGERMEGRKDLTVLPGGPYRYLDYLDVRDGDLFYGRESEVEHLKTLITKHPLSVLCGPDGTGKSSLMRAGVAAAMIAEEKESEQRPSLIPVVVSCIGEPAEDVRRAVESTLHDRGWLVGPRLSAESFVEAMVEATEVAQTGLAILLDGFEHCIVRRGPATRRGFAQVTAACAERLGDRWRLCVAIREEFLGYLLDLQNYWPGMFEAVLRLGRLSQSQAIDAVLKPGPAFFCYPESELAEQVAADLDDGGVLPAHLQIVMHRLYEQRSWGSSSITLKMYEHVGGAEAILRECIDFPLSQLGQRDRRLARTILNRLVGSQNTTVPKSPERLIQETKLDRERVERVLARLVDLRLVRAVGLDKQRRYQLIHPYLAEELASELSEQLLAAAKYTDAIARATDEWLHTGVMPSARLLHRLRGCRDVMWLMPREMEAVLRAAAVYGVDLDYWLRRSATMGEERLPVLRRLLHDSDERVRRAAAEGLGQTPDGKSLTTLVDGLHDQDETVRERATHTLETYDRKLVDSLSTDEPTMRQRAAHALGIIGRERHVGPLVGALRDGDDEFTDQATRALSQVGPARAEHLLLQRLVEETNVPWSVAYALGHLATDTKTLRTLEAARRGVGRQSLAKLDYAIGRARLTRGELEAAEKALQAAQSETQDGGGQRAIQAALDELADMRERLSDRDPVDWPMFGGDPARRAFRRRQLKLPLVRRWQFKTEEAVVASPAVAKGLAYIGSRDGSLYCVDVNTGAQNWRLSAKERIESSAAVVEGKVVFGSMDGTVYCADASSGNRKWVYEVGSPIRAAMTICGGLVYAAAQRGRLVALTLDSGEAVWQVTTSGDIVSAPAIMGERLFLGGWDGLIRCLNARTGEEIWHRDVGGEVSGAPAVAEGRVFCPSDAGCMLVLNAEDGQELWRTPLQPPVRCSPALTEEIVIVGDESGRVLCLSVSSGEPQWEVTLNDEVSGSPAIAGDLVFLGSVDGALRALDVRTGEERWQEKTAFGVYSSPAIAGEMVLVGMGYYDLWAFAHKPETMAPGAINGT